MSSSTNYNRVLDATLAAIVGAVSYAALEFMSTPAEQKPIRVMITGAAGVLCPSLSWPAVLDGHRSS